MTTQPLQFLRRGQPVALGNVPPDRTLLEVLREDLGCSGTKEGCGEGDCGACTVVLGEARDGKVHYSAVNSCIRLAHSIHGMALWTVEDLAEDPLIESVNHPPTTAHLLSRTDGEPSYRSTASGTDVQACGDVDEQERKSAAPLSGTTTPPLRATGLHPVQEAMVQCHGSQCGFCTPGFVMSLFGMYQNHVCQGRAITRELAQEELSGNLCRCTGYRPIFDAAQQMGALPGMAVNETDLLQKLELLTQSNQALEARSSSISSYIAPTTLPALLAARAAHPSAQVVAGCTDVGLWVTKQHRQFTQVIDVTRAAEMRRIERRTDHLAIGAAVTLTDAFAALTAQWPQLHRFATRFAGLPVRNSGTLGGNVANGSPIGDSMPLLIALRAQVVLASAARDERTLALEDLYTGYRQNVMAPDELLVRILVPHSNSTEQLRAYKISKRFDDDISAVCLVFNLDIVDGTVQRASIGAGGVAATPARAVQTEAALLGQPWNEATVQKAKTMLQAEFNPISDMRASGAYRRAMLASLLQRYWLESQGHKDVSVEDFRVEVSL
ncbi:MAG: xanthine dehydrogenase small subunit [Burkholderiaceae bacterium]|nr:xanthine dehydrogenase small subunit [Burkholderiaceae bacterium]